MRMPIDARRPGAALALAAAAAALLCATPGAQAAALPATVTVSQPCYVLVGKVTPLVTITGSGFPASSNIDISDKLGLDDSTTADANGDFTVTEPAPNPVLANPGQKKDTITAEAFDANGTEYAGSTSTFLSSFEAAFSGSKPAPGLKALEERVKWAFSGFPVGSKIWGHYTFKGKLVATQAFGKASAPCGVLKLKKRAFPGKPKHRKYTLQIDTKKKYAKKTEPAFKLTLGLTLF